MPGTFPHLPGNEAGYPGPGRELYEQIQGSFDYASWQEGATVTLCSVPWGVYEAGVSTDRPGFDTVEERDAWFAQYLSDAGRVSEAHRLETRVRYQIDDYVQVPFTFDYAARYNYLIVDYPDAPVPGGTGGIKRWFYHVTAIDYGSPSCTSLSLVPDWWTTCAPLMSISHMVLERGHAPVAETSVSDYLAAPLENSEYLLAEDVDFGTRAVVASHYDNVVNGGAVWAVICLRGVPATGDFGGYLMPFDNSTFVQGVPSDWQFAVQASQLEGFLDVWAANAPQAMQAMDALYLCGESLLAFTGETTLWGYTVRTGAHGAETTYSHELTQADFGYSSDIAGLAKLYTYPYARIEVATDQGATVEVRVEDLASGSVDVVCALNGAFPWLRISAHVAGVGGAVSQLAFSTATAHTFAGGGRWYDTLMEWGVPCYQIHQSNAQANDYRTHYSRVQRANDAETAYSNATASAATAQENAVASADTAYTNSVTSNNTAYTNTENQTDLNTTQTALAISNNTSVTSNSVSYATQGANLNITKLSNDTQTDRFVSSATTEVENDAIALTTANNQASTIASGAVSAMVSLSTLDFSGVATSIADTVGSCATANASAEVSQSTNETLALIAQTAASDKALHATSYITDAQSVQNSQTNAITTLRNTLMNQQTINTNGTMLTNAENTRTTGNANAARTQATATANAGRTYNTAVANAERTRSNAYAAIDNSVSEAAMQAPLSFGSSQDGAFSNTRPMVVSVNVVTESKSAIRQAATQFLRYGYALHQTWEWDTWNLMRNFTYWEVSDVWATGVDAVPEEALDAVRRMLHQGVTVWRDPDKIGKVSIYDNE